VTVDSLLESFLDVNMVNLTMVSISNFSKSTIQSNKKLGRRIHHTKQKTRWPYPPYQSVNLVALSKKKVDELGGFVQKKWMTISHPGLPSNQTHPK
jgi:hypothetical protein